MTPVVTLTRVERLERAAVRLLGRVPPQALETIVRRRPVNRAGDRLAPEIALALAALNRMPDGDFSALPVEQGRRQIDAEAEIFAERFAPFFLEEEVTIPGPGGPIPATRYRATEPSQSSGPRGLAVYFHGGGWVLGSRSSTESPVRFLALHADVDVLSVDYRLAPEHPFPAAIEDAHAAWAYAVDHAEAWGVDPARIAIAGDSAGGNITAVLALELRGAAVEPRFQLLIFPVTDLTRSSASYLEFAEGFFLTAQQMDFYARHYLRDPAQVQDPRVSPLLAPDVSGAPPAYVAVAGFDPLRDEGIAYAEKLREAGVEVELAREGELIHAFINTTGVSRTAREATLRAAAALRTRCAGDGAGE